MEFKKLLSPGKIGSMELKNRFIVPAMGTNYGSADGKVTDQVIAYYKKRAEGGFGLIIIEVTAIDSRGRALPYQIGLWSDEQIPGFKKLVDAIHAAGSKVIIQLHHAGRQTGPHAIFGEAPEAPSKIACPIMDSMPEEMSEERIWELIDEFGDAAIRAKKAGADGVEVHGAHGYLIAQFMSPHANKRTDEFGGDFMGRMKFPMEIFKNIRQKVGRDYPMTFRFSYDEKVNGGRTLEESVAVARLAEECSVDALNVSIMTYASSQYMSAPPAMPNGFNQFPTKVIKEAVDIPVISVGRYNPIIAENALLSGCADFIDFGRASIAEPELPNKVKEGRLDEITPCIGCTQSCIGYVFVGNPISCLVNPITGHEFEWDMSKVEKPKNVLVVGAGPAGLEAALVAAKKGHKVTVCEKQNMVGGQFRLAAIPPTKHEIASAIKYYLHMGKKLGVTYELGREVTEEYVKSLNPDVVILATGGIPAKPNILGIDGEKIVDAIDVLKGNVVPGRKVLVIGGGMTGVETAEFMAEHNRQVTILEMREDIALDEAIAARAFLMPRLAQYGVEKIVNAKVDHFTEDGVVYIQNDESKELGGFDTIVLAMGVRPHNPLEKTVRSLVDEVYVIGDAQKPGPANHATETAIAAVMNL